MPGKTLTGETRPNHFKLLANSCRRSWWFKTSFLIFSAGQQLNTTWCRNKYKTIQVIIQKVLLNDQGGDTECRTTRLTISSGFFSSITIIDTIVSPKAIQNCCMMLVGLTIYISKTFNIRQQISHRYNIMYIRPFYILRFC